MIPPSRFIHHPYRRRRPDKINLRVFIPLWLCSLPIVYYVQTVIPPYIEPHSYVLNNVIAPILCIIVVLLMLYPIFFAPPQTEDEWLQSLDEGTHELGGKIKVA